MSPPREDRARTHPPESTPLWTTMLACRTRLLGARPAPSPDSTATHPSPRPEPRGTLDAMRHEHGRPGDRPREAATRRDGRHSHRMHRNLERSREPAFPNSPRSPPDVVTKRPTPRTQTGPSAVPTQHGVGRSPPPAAHPRWPHIPVGRTSPPPHRAEPLHDAERPSVNTRRRAGTGPGGAGSSGGRHTDPALRPSGTGRRGVPQDRGRRGSCRRRRAGARGRSRRGRVPGARRGRCR